MPPDVELNFPTAADANLFAEEILHKFQMRLCDPA
jgi:hypothetical protein